MSALIIVLVAVLLPRFAADYLNYLGTGSPASIAIEAGEIRGCTILPSLAAVDHAPELGSFRGTAYRCDDQRFDLVLWRFPPRVGVRELFTNMQTALQMNGEGWDILGREEFRIGSGADAQRWHAIEAKTPDGRTVVAAGALWIGSQPTNGISARVKQAVNSVSAFPAAPVLALVIHSGTDTPDVVTLNLKNFLYYSIKPAAILQSAAVQ